MKKKAFSVMCLLVKRDKSEAFKELKDLVEESNYDENLVNAFAELPDSKNLSKVARHVALFIKHQNHIEIVRETKAEVERIRSSRS